MNETLTTEEHTEAHGDKIKGYPKLNESEIEVINLVKEAEVVVGKLWQKIGSNDLVEVDPRWHAMAKTDLQTGFMKLTRSIARPPEEF